jgi:CRP/FNR family transcriptional regulator, cyclic AMP receptor protein
MVALAYSHTAFHTSTGGLETSALLASIQTNPAPDRLRLSLTAAQWAVFNDYLQPMLLASGQVLMREGSSEYTLYFVEYGALSVHRQTDGGHLRMAVIGPGSVVGEGAFFSHQPRSATVTVMSNARLWCLTSGRFTELSHRQPDIAVAVSMALGSVMSRRMPDTRRRAAIT